MAIEDYHVIELVGEGSFGKVYKGRRKYTRQVCDHLKNRDPQLTSLALGLVELIFHFDSDCRHEVYS